MVDAVPELPNSPKYQSSKATIVAGALTLCHKVGSAAAAYFAVSNTVGKSILRTKFLADVFASVFLTEKYVVSCQELVRGGPEPDSDKPPKVVIKPSCDRLMAFGDR